MREMSQTGPGPGRKLFNVGQEDMKKEMPSIDAAICDGCGLCVGVCRCGALVMEHGKVQVIPVNSCGWCGLCELVCPTGAITCPYEIIVEDGRE
jgi:MinD superfamily P-loop ATPase